jgi:hypothetical protein
MVNLKPNSYQGSSIACKFGYSMKFIQHRSRDIQTTFEWIRIKRVYYHCSDCRAALFPYDRASGLGSFNISAAMADACCLVDAGGRKEVFGAIVPKKDKDSFINKCINYTDKG